MYSVSMDLCRTKWIQTAPDYGAFPTETHTYLVFCQ